MAVGSKRKIDPSLRVGMTKCTSLERGAIGKIGLIGVMGWELLDKMRVGRRGMVLYRYRVVSLFLIYYFRSKFITKDYYGNTGTD